MISSFTDIQNILDSDQDAYVSDIIENLSTEEIQALQSAVDEFDTEMVKVYKTLQRFNIKPPIIFLKGVLKNNLNLAYETYCGSIDDTYARDILIDALSETIGMSKHWPYNCDGDSYTLSFLAEFKEKCSFYNIEIIKKVA